MGNSLNSKQQKFEDAINRMGYGDYLREVADFIKFAKENSIEIGPHRGSGTSAESEPNILQTVTEKYSSTEFVTQEKKGEERKI